jgi:acyl-homoserine lactone acylase PvdQ
VIGKSKYMAWGVTMVINDNQDYFKEQLDGNKYLYEGEWMNLKIRE